MRRTTTFTVLENGIPLDVSLIESPNIDDVIISEARLQAFSIATGADLATHRVDPQIKDLLLRLGVER